MKRRLHYRLLTLTISIHHIWRNCQALGFPSLPISTEEEYKTISDYYIPHPTKKYIEYGLYRCIIEPGDDDINNKLFSYNQHNYYTHYDIYSAEMLGLRVTLINDGEANALIYGTRGSGSLYFGQIVNQLYKLKSESKLAKRLLHRIYGCLCSRNKKYTNKQYIHQDENKVVGIFPAGDSDCVVFLKRGEYYKFPYARIGPFLTGSSRYELAKTILPIKEKVHRVHTDSILSSIALNLPVSDALGDWYQIYLQVNRPELKAAAYSANKYNLLIVYSVSIDCCQ